MIATIPLQKPKSTPVINNSILESLKAIGGGVTKSVAHDVVGGVATDALGSLFGTLPKQGELKPNQSLDFNQTRPEIQPRLQFRRPEITHPPIVRLREVNLEQKVDAVRNELKALASSLKSFNAEIDRAVMEVPVQAGVYHMNFFERLRSLIVSLKQQVEDSRTWLSLWTSRKKKKGYWGMFKKHGTSFGLSNERALATQAG